MSDQAGYSRIPREAPCNRKRQTVLIINGTPIPAVAAGSCLVFVAGLVMWAAGMLQARATVDGIFTDLGLAADSLEHLKVTVLASVVVLLVLSVAALAANVWLEVKRTTGMHNPAGAAAALRVYASNALKVNGANWVLLLLVAFALAGSITWLTTMSTALSATQQSGSYGGTFTATQHLQASGSLRTIISGSNPSLQQLQSEVAPKLGPEQQQQQWTAAAARTCPPGCVDLGIIAQVLGLPWPCFCQVWLLRDLVEQLQKVVAQLWVAVSGAVLLFAAVSWVYGFLAAEAVHAGYGAQEGAQMHAGGSAGNTA